MSEVVKTQLVWNYKPHNFFEQPVSIESDGWNIGIEDGKAVATIDNQDFKINEALKQNLTRRILSRFQGVQLLTHRDFELGDCIRTDIKDNGKKVTYVETHSIVQVQAIGSVGYIVRDKEGNVTVDSKKERFEDEERIDSLIDKYRDKDQVLDHILDFYQDALSDPDDELVHLYNIRDSLKDKFGSKKRMLNNLEINQTDYDRFGELTNYLPLNQGRHKGVSIGSLRDAKDSELNEARRIAAKFIHSYLNYLDGSD